MATITIQIGNSDNKLTQQEWASFCQEMQWHIEKHCQQIHFCGYSAGNLAWQNACWVVEINKDYIDELQEWIADIRKRYLQDSVSWTEGSTEFI